MKLHVVFVAHFHPWTADARTYYSRLQVNHGMDFEEAQKYRDEYIQGKKDAGLQVSDRNGFYISSTIKDQGKTGRLHIGSLLLRRLNCSRNPIVGLCSESIADIILI